MPFDENEFPLGYLITFRTYGTWLHGDDRSSVARGGLNVYGTPRIEPDQQLESDMREEMAGPPFILTKPMRRVVESAIKDLCKRREYVLYAVNVRSNHAHSVVFGRTKPERIADALKANATKMLRENSLIDSETKPWSRGRSRRYLWKPHHLTGAIDYVLYCQSDMPFDLID